MGRAACKSRSETGRLRPRARASAAGEPHLPELRTHDRWGRRIDQIECSSRWHELMTLAMRDEFHSLCWTKSQAGAQWRGAVSYLCNQAENGVCCPLGTTYSATADLASRSGPRAEFGKLVTSTTSTDVSFAERKNGAAGRHGDDREAGRSDRRQTQTSATKNSDGIEFARGHKWFVSGRTRTCS